jgi:dienelactone hydrolase
VVFTKRFARTPAISFLMPIAIMRSLSALLLAPLALAQEFPTKGDNGQLGGIFGFSGPLNAPAGGGGGGATNLLADGPESPKKGLRLTNGGSGPYKAAYTTDPSLPKHTIYAPKTPPAATLKMPVIVWGNGACTMSGTMFKDFLTEIASYGYLVISNGLPVNTTNPTDPNSDFISAMTTGQSKASMLTDSVDWVTNGGAAKYGNIDQTKIAAAGQSCGGLESLSASYHDDRIKRTVLFNSGVIDRKKKYLLKQLKYPVAYFTGQKLDGAQANVGSP